MKVPENSTLPPLLKEMDPVTCDPEVPGEVAMVHVKDTAAPPATTVAVEELLLEVLVVPPNVSLQDPVVTVFDVPVFSNPTVHLPLPDSQLMLLAET